MEVTVRFLTLHRPLSKERIPPGTHYDASKPYASFDAPAENQFLSCSACSLVTIPTMLPWLGEQYPDNEIHKSDTRIPLY